MTSLTGVRDDIRDQWRHELNHASYALSKMREALGVVGAMQTHGSLEGLIIDLERIQRVMRDMQIEAAVEIRLAKAKEGA